MQKQVCGVCRESEHVCCATCGRCGMCYAYAVKHPKRGDIDCVECSASVQWTFSGMVPKKQEDILQGEQCLECKNRVPSKTLCQDHDTCLACCDCHCELCDRRSAACTVCQGCDRCCACLYEQPVHVCSVCQAAESVQLSSICQVQCVHICHCNPADYR